MDGLRKSHAGSQVNPRGARPGSRRGRSNYAGIRLGRGAAARCARFAVARRRAALAHAPYDRWGAGKGAFAIGRVTIGALVLTGLDKRVETLLVDQSSQWLTDLTTRF